MSTTEKPKDKLEAQIKSADMTDDMQQEAIDVAQEAMNKFTVEKDIAMHIKKTFDERKGPTWHCIVGPTSDHLSLTRQSTSYTSTSVTAQSSSSRPSKRIYPMPQNASSRFTNARNSVC